MTITEARDNVGAGVVYRPAYGDAEDGTIIRVSDVGAYVFVRYRGSETPKATRPEELELLAGA